MTITTLEVYKGDTYCLIADGDKRIYINRQIIDKFDLKEGMDITREQFTEIMFASELRKAQRRGMYLINQNEYSYRQMFEKLQKNYPDEICYKVCDAMVQKGYINDIRYAKALVYNYMNCKLFGPKRAQQELYRRGIKGKAAQLAMEQGTEGLYERLLELIDRKYSNKLDPDDPKSIDRVKNGLLRAGYEHEDIDRAVREYLEDREQECD